uniref:IML14 n=1 Tax=Mythimna separata TaxID=271217 RepID=A0A8F3HKR0_MYTSE|nr:IML14 [Mythimna separata]
MFSNFFLLFLFAVFVSDSYGQRDKKFFRKDYHYLEALESFYKIHTIPKTWSDAKQVCALEAASFFYPENDDEANAMTSLWEKMRPNIKWVWIGISDLLVEGVFVTVDGKSIHEVYCKWFDQGQPDNAGGKENCLNMDLKGQMNDYPCDVKSYFICKKSLQSLEWNNQCNMPNLDYIFSKNTGKCYKLHTAPLNWTEAYAMCQVEQSSLAIISNQREANFLAKLTVSTPKPRIQEKYSRGIYHVGFHNRLNEGWQTLKGTRMNADAADLWFDNYQPDGTGNGACGAMFFNGRLINTDCDTKSFFICEHELDNTRTPASISS